MNIGTTIKHIREQKKIRQNIFAEKIGISQEYLSKIENNRRQPAISILEKIGKELDVPLPILFFLSMSEDDVKEEKKARFKEINPFIKSLVDTLYLEDTK